MSVVKKKSATAKLKFKLRPNQVPHVKNLCEILKTHKCALDLSDPGNGKTYTSSYIAARYKLNALVICPVSMEAKWRGMKDLGVPVWDVKSYESLRGTKSYQPKGLLLKRFDNDKGTYFRLHEFFKFQLEQGFKVLIIIDESHKTKNNTAQHKAVCDLINEVIKYSPHSRAIMLSGTILSKKENAVNLIKILNITKQDKMWEYDRSTRSLQLLGMLDLIDFCDDHNPSKTKEIISKPITASTAPAVVYELFINVVKDIVSSKMKNPFEEKFLHINNYFYCATKTEKLKINEVVGSFRPAGSSDVLSFFARLAGDSKSFGVIQKVLWSLEMEKINIFIRGALKYLAENKRGKIVICLSFTDSLKAIAEGLCMYKPLILNGAVSKGEREARLKRFQRSDIEYRVLIGNKDVLKEGIDLDDKHGGYPRMAMVSPNYDITTIYQFSRRFLRSTDTKSHTTINMVYTDTDLPELFLIKSLTKKSSFLRDGNDNGNTDVLYPDKYETVMGSEAELLYTVENNRVRAAEKIKKWWIKVKMNPRSPGGLSLINKTISDVIDE